MWKLQIVPSTGWLLNYFRDFYFDHIAFPYLSSYFVSSGRNNPSAEGHIKTPPLRIIAGISHHKLNNISMLLWRGLAVSRTLTRWGRGVHRGGDLHHRSYLCSSSRCHGVSAGEGNTQSAETGSAQGLYRDTVLLPRTDFPMKLAGQKLLDREVEIQEVRPTSFGQIFSSKTFEMFDDFLVDGMPRVTCLFISVDICVISSPWNTKTLLFQYIPKGTI